jgi:hypothetical protein
MCCEINFGPSYPQQGYLADRGRSSVPGRIGSLNPKLNAIVAVADDTLQSAKVAEAGVMNGEKLAPLHGAPFTVKDSIDTARVPTQRGSPIFWAHSRSRRYHRRANEGCRRDPAGEDQSSEVLIRYRNRQSFDGQDQ